MLTIDIPLLITALLFGFAGGYGARELKSRQRHRRWREKYWYGPPPTSARTASERASVPTSQGIIERYAARSTHIGIMKTSYPGGYWAAQDHTRLSGREHNLVQRQEQGLDNGTRPASGRGTV